MSFLVKSENSDYEDVSNFAEELTVMIMEEDNHIYQGDIEVSDITVDDVEDLNDSFNIDENFEEDEY